MASVRVRGGALAREMSAARPARMTSADKTADESITAMTSSSVAVSLWSRWAIRLSNAGGTGSAKGI